MAVKSQVRSHQLNDCAIGDVHGELNIVFGTERTPRAVRLVKRVMQGSKHARVESVREGDTVGRWRGFCVQSDVAGAGEGGAR